jgi:hypothetical protein
MFQPVFHERDGEKCQPTVKFVFGNAPVGPMFHLKDKFRKLLAMPMTRNVMAGFVPAGQEA